MEKIVFKMKAKNLLIIIAILAVIIAGFFIFINKKIPQTSPTVSSTSNQQSKDIEKEIENWSLYTRVSDQNLKKFGNDDACGNTIAGNKDFLNYENQAEAGDVYKLDLQNGVSLFYTPNYLNWTNNKLLSFSSEDMKICSIGWPAPLFAYPDKIVWGYIFCGGVESPQTEACSKTSDTITNYFNKKKNNQ